ncbi:MAG TPA: YceI family protein [Solirubrobacteraceae bacterium]|jgi:polyisoprenoid-binding protein YceI
MRRERATATLAAIDLPRGMSSPPTLTDLRLPTGRWDSDPAASSVGFSIAAGDGTLAAAFTRFRAQLDVAPSGDAVLTGTAAAGSLAVADRRLAVLVATPPFLDAARHPELSFASTAIVRDGERVELDGRLTIKGRTLTVTATGRLDESAGLHELRLALQTRLDRRQFGLDWPGGAGDDAGAGLGTEARLRVDLRLRRTEPPPAAGGACAARA